MTIITEAAGTELTSPFFIRNNRFAKAYTDFANDCKGEITGTVNAYLFETELMIPIEFGHVKIKAKTQTKNVQSGFSAKTSPVQSTSIFEVVQTHRSVASWSIRPRSLFTNCVSLLRDVSKIASRPELVFITQSNEGNHVLPQVESLLANLLPLGLIKLNQKPNSLTAHFGRICNNKEELTYITNSLQRFYMSQ